MSGIQILLISSFVFVALYYFSKLKNRIVDVMLLLGLVATAVTFVAFPEITGIIAAKLGVGRGADLVFYICIVTFCFVVLKLYIKMRKLENTITHLLRRESKEHAKEMKESD
jgi:small membrane protein